MANTRSKLVPAQIYEIKGGGGTLIGGLGILSGITKGITVNCMFNPFEYSVSKTNTFSEDPKKGDVPHVEFKKSGPQTLKLELFFDSYETGEDISEITNLLWKLMETTTKLINQTTKKVEPPEVAFEWGVFRFIAVITNMTQKFTMFKLDGTPVRAKVDVTFTQYIDINDYPKQNPTSGGGDIERIWQVVAGDRLDTIAYQVYGETKNWCHIADRNRLRDPMTLIPGQKLIIPTIGE